VDKRGAILSSQKVSLIHDTVRSDWSFIARDGTDYWPAKKKKEKQRAVIPSSEKVSLSSTTIESCKKVS
jgi:hypothetical protein